MRKTVLWIACAAALAGAAHAADTRTLSAFLSNCKKDSAVCRGALHDFILAADQQAMICKPEDVSLREAVGKTLDWLQDAVAKDQQLADGDAEDAMFAAISTLWPCPKPPPEAPPPSP